MAFGKKSVELVTCPRCGKDVPVTAKRCRYCDTDFERFAKVREIENWRQGQSPLTVPPHPSVLQAGAASAPTGDSRAGITDELERLRRLRADGVIDEDEFKAAKAKILGL